MSSSDPVPPRSATGTVAAVFDRLRVGVNTPSDSRLLDRLAREFRAAVHPTIDGDDARPRHLSSNHRS
jgi:hypothetical protein